MQVFLVILLAWSASATDWNLENCPPSMGTVADVACCKDDICGRLSKGLCDKEARCLWFDDKYAEKQGGKCVPNRDKMQRVCCKSKVEEVCTAVVEGFCPNSFQVPTECCAETSRNWEGVLLSQDNYVCCNDPCTQLGKLCPKLKESYNCTKGARSSYNQGLHQNLYGFNQAYMPTTMQSYGNIYGLTGFEQSANHLPATEGGIKEKVDEITVDDLMSSLVEALSHDPYTIATNPHLKDQPKDGLFHYTSATETGPYFGKTRNVINSPAIPFVDPDVWIDQIYGSPYGLSHGQYGFGGQGWPAITPAGNSGGGYGGQSGGYGGQSGGYGGQSGGYGGQSGGYGNPQFSGFGSSGGFGQPGGYANQMSGGYANQMSGGYANQMSGGYANQVHGGFGTPQSGGYANQQFSGFGNQQFGGYGIQQPGGYGGQQPVGYASVFSSSGGGGGYGW